MTARSVRLTSHDIDLLLDALSALEYWEYGTELGLPRCNGQVFLPADDATEWRGRSIGADEENAIEQIGRARALRDLLSGVR